MRYLYILAVFLLVLSGSSKAAVPDSTMQMNTAEWSSICAGDDYRETYTERKEDPDKTTNVKPSVSLGSIHWGGMRYLYYGLVLGAIVGIAIWLMRKSGGNKEVAKSTPVVETLEQIEEHLHEIDLESLLRDASASGNFRLALRLHFLIIIKLLTQKGYIEWAREKTNWEYHREVTDSAVAEGFREVIVAFENSWYGEHPLDIREYYRVESACRELQASLEAV